MRLLDVIWSATVNQMVVACGRCGGAFFHRVDRWKVQCPDCRLTASINDLRRQPLP